MKRLARTWEGTTTSAVWRSEFLSLELLPIAGQERTTHSLQGIKVRMADAIPLCKQKENIVRAFSKTLT